MLGPTPYVPCHGHNPIIHAHTIVRQAHRILSHRMSVCVSIRSHQSMLSPLDRPTRRIRARSKFLFRVVCRVGAMQSCSAICIVDEAMLRVTRVLPLLVWPSARACIAMGIVWSHRFIATMQLILPC